MASENGGNSLREEVEQTTFPFSEQYVKTVLPAKGKDGPRVILTDEPDNKFIPFNSYNYLGLAQHPKVIKASQRAIKTFGTNTGGGMRTGGANELHSQLESAIADFHSREDAVLFKSASTANAGVIQALAIDGHTWVFSEQLNHESIPRGIKYAGIDKKNVTVYKHNDIGEIERTLSMLPKMYERVLLITDGVFSSLGDHADLSKFVEMAHKYDSKFPKGVITIVDDSQGVGAFGNTGRGTPEVTGEYGVDVYVATLNKALGTDGGYVTGSHDLVNLLKRATPYFFTGAVPAGSVAAGLASFEVLDSKEGRNLLGKLHDNTDYFRKGIEELGYNTIIGENPIVPLLVGENVSQVHDFLYENGILTTAFVPPTTKKGDEFIRFQITAQHTKKDLDYALNVLEQAKEKIK